MIRELKAVTSSANLATNDPELQQEINRTEIGFEQWLPYAAKAFDLSTELKDYYITAAPLLTTEISNRNGVAFPNNEVLAWNRDLGRQAYKGWQGMPLHVEHKADNPKEAIGVVADVTIKQIKGFNGSRILKIVALVAVDTTKNTAITHPIRDGLRTTWSMGCYVNHYSCGYCGALEGKCQHIDPKKPVEFYEIDGVLVFRNVHGVTPFEFSSVADPAFPAAIHRHDWAMAY